MRRLRDARTAARHYHRKTGPWGECVHFGPGAGAGPVDLMLRRAGCLKGPLAVLYLSPAPRRSSPPGRYQSPFPTSRRKTRAFFERFREFLERNGRHAGWILTGSPRERTIYDRHEALFAYGEVKKSERVLAARRCVPGDVTCSLADARPVRETYDAEEERLFQYWAWTHSPLWSGDDL